MFASPAAPKAGRKAACTPTRQATPPPPPPGRLPQDQSQVLASREFLTPSPGIPVTLTLPRPAASETEETLVPDLTSLPPRSRTPSLQAVGKSTPTPQGCRGPGHSQAPAPPPELCAWSWSPLTHRGPSGAPHRAPESILRPPPRSCSTPGTPCALRPAPSPLSPSLKDSLLSWVRPVSGKCAVSHTGDLSFPSLPQEKK